MSTTVDYSPTAHVRFGAARTDITPPVGIYHRMWGAARHDRATGVHRPIYADIIALSPQNQSQQEHSERWIQGHIDMVGLAPEQHNRLVEQIATAANCPRDRVSIAYSHTHSGGVFLPNRIEFPGGEMIEPYLTEVGHRLAVAASQAITAQQEATITFGNGQCAMAANRDFWDEGNQLFACGYHPQGEADQTVLVARVTSKTGQQLATLVNYGCHPTTLAWENTLISPDYVGAMREEVERATHAPCVFLLGACGDLGPRRSHLGDTAIADQNGRQLAYSVLEVLTGLDPAGQDFVYQGPVISGATLGTWAPAPQTGQRLETTTCFSARNHTVDLPQIPRPDPQTLQQQLDDWTQRQADADARGAAIEARDYGARAERVRRWLLRVQSMTDSPTYTYAYTILRLGDAIWVGLQGEPYNAIQTELRRRFGDRPIIVVALTGEAGASYLLPADRFGKGLYQEEPAILGPGCLEQLTDAVAASIETII